MKIASLVISFLLQVAASFFGIKLAVWFEEHLFWKRSRKEGGK